MAVSSPGRASAVPTFVGIDMALGGTFGSGSWVGDTAYSSLAVPGSLLAALPSSIEPCRWLCRVWDEPRPFLPSLVSTWLLVVPLEAVAGLVTPPILFWRYLAPSWRLYHHRSSLVGGCIESGTSLGRSCLRWYRYGSWWCLWSGSWVGDTAYLSLAVPGSLLAALPSSIEPCWWLYRVWDEPTLSKELQAPASIRCHCENVLFELIGHGGDAIGATVARGGLVPSGGFGRVKIFPPACRQALLRIT